MISVIISIYQRKDNLRLVLAALDKQSVKNFEIVVSSDGCSDNPVQRLLEYDTRLNLRYCWHQHRGWGVCKARNDGAKFATGDAYLFIDSDVMLNEHALGHYKNLFEANPAAIIAGRYDWLPPMDITPHDVYQNWEKIVAWDLPMKEESKIGIQGPDPRYDENPDIFDSSKARDKHCLWLFGGNLLIPKRIYRMLGGYDENIVGHGGEDAEFGMRAQEANVKAIFSDEVIGYHIHHWRDEERGRREVKKNIEYMESKHDLAALGVQSGEEGELPLVDMGEAENDA